MRALVLTGSSGFLRIRFTDGTFRRKDRDFIREKAALTFYDPAMATDEIVDEAYVTVNDRGRALRLLGFARSAQRETLEDRLHLIDCPTAVIWGRNDRITPPNVAESIGRRIADAELYWIDKCGHAPMMERPQQFNRSLLEFLDRRIRCSTSKPAGVATGE